MNYNAKIKKMLDSGVITEANADKLAQTLESNNDTAIEGTNNKTKKIIYDRVLYSLFALVFGVFIFFMPETNNVAVDVSQNLNNSANLGFLSTKITLIFTILLVISILYSMFYVILSFSYRKLLRFELDILIAQADFKNINLYENELKSVLVEDELSKIYAYKNTIKEYLTTKIFKYESMKQNFPYTLGLKLKKFKTFKGVSDE